MLKNLLCCAVMAVVCAGCVNINAEKNSVSAKPECKAPAKMLRHMLLFRFKESTTPEQIKEVEAAFASLPDKIDAIKCFEWGTNVSVENRSEGFTHCFVVTFANEAGLDAYLNHPDLKEFRKTLGGPLEKALVIDYWAK
jgi:quinol monooxygenase YgiN